MKTYSVMFEVLGNVIRLVDAESPEDAVEKARSLGTECLKEVEEAYLGSLVSVHEE